MRVFFPPLGTKVTNPLSGRWYDNPPVGTSFGFNSPDFTYPKMGQCEHCGGDELHFDSRTQSNNLITRQAGPCTGTFE